MVSTRRAVFHFSLRQRHTQETLSRHSRLCSLASRGFSAQPLQKEDSVPLAPHFHSHHHDNEIFSSPKAHFQANEPRPKIGRLVLVRHGQSEWNVTDPTRNLTARFTGWADIGLTQQGRDQAVAAGRAIQLAAEKRILPSKENDDHVNVPAIDVVFCSLLRRSIDTMNIILEEINLAERLPPANLEKENNKEPSPEYQYPIPIIHSWRLNERHYGSLVGLSKEGAERLFGKLRLTRWRDSWDVAPPPMPLEMVKRWGSEDHCQPVTIVKKGVSGRTCVFDPASAGVQSKKIVEHGGRRKNAPDTTVDRPDDDNVTFMPPSESLRDTYQRFLPLWIQGIAPHLRAGRTVLVVGHANTIRSMLFAIDADVVTKENSKKVKIPSALPLVYEFVDRDGSGCELNDNNYGGQVPINGTTGSKYTVGGRECSNLLPGNLRVLKPLANSNANKGGSNEVRHQLSGVWVETEETKSVSFCTEIGQKAGEQDIA